MVAPVPPRALLPGHAGGVLGYIVGPASVKWLGFTGSGLVGIVLSWCWGLPWCSVFPGGMWPRCWVPALMPWCESRLARREVAKDVAVGRKAARERAVVVLEERTESEEHHPAPVQIEPVRWMCPKSARVPKSAEAPVHRMPDSKLPQVDLLDGPRPPGDRVARDAGDDQPPDREEAQGLRRGGARGGGHARPGDHPLRDRAGHGREGLADRGPGQGPGALAQPGVHPRGRDHSRQELHGAGAAQRQAPDHPPVRDPGLAGLPRGQVAC
jgi:hypothetical protein